MNLPIDEIITDRYMLQENHTWHDGFVFTRGEENPVRFNRMVVRNPQRARDGDGRMGFSHRRLEEHIQFINQNNIQKVRVYCEDLSFIRACPGLSDLEIHPAYGAENGFDYSPLYEMPNIKHLACITEYGDDNSFRTTVDYSKIKGVEGLTLHGSGHLHVQKVHSLKRIWMYGNKKVKTVSAINDGSSLEDLTVWACGLKSLEGIELHKNMQHLSLYRNSFLTDISRLGDIGGSLRSLHIESCGKIRDFAALDYLTNLEFLQLDGSNTLPNLDFLEKMPRLKVFTFTMNVEDGDLSKCLPIPYVSCKNRKHFNLKDCQLPKKKWDEE